MAALGTTSGAHATRRVVLAMASLTIALLLAASAAEAKFLMFADDPAMQQGDSLLAPPLPPSTRFLYELRMQNDCNLVLYDQGASIWASGTATARPQPRGTCSALLTSDGDFKVVHASGRVLWSSGTAGVLPGSTFMVELQQDRNLVLYTEPRDGIAPQAVWSTRTNLP